MQAAEMSLANKLLFTTARIETKDKSGQSSSGTGFFASLHDDGKRQIPILVTNWHVVSKAEEATVFVTVEDEAGNPKIGEPYRLDFTGFSKGWVRHPDPSVDLAAMPLARIHTGLLSTGTDMFYHHVNASSLPDEEQLDDLSALEEIVMVGYPLGLSDTSNNLPILRKGISATHPSYDFCGRKEFLVDIACFPGSSGSPVFLMNQGMIPRKGGFSVGTRLLFLGVLYAGPMYGAEGKIIFKTIPTSSKPTANVQIPTNLGVVIKGERVFEFESVFEKPYPPTP